MSSYVPAPLRQLVAARAQHLCEYCLIHEEDTFLGCQVEHIISEKHGGETIAENLAYACVFCNRFKGSDIGSIARRTGVLTPFYNPRRDRWHEHFSLREVHIEPLSDIGQVTASILEFNHPDRLTEREALKRVGRFPPTEAIILLKPPS